VTRVPPSDLAAEAAVLSACLLSRDALDEARALLECEDFYAERNQVVWTAALELDRQGQRADVVTIAAHLTTTQQLGRVGGKAYLAELLDGTPAVAHVGEHAAIVRRKAQQRRVVAACERFAAEGYGQVPDVERWAQDAASELERVASARSERARGELFADLLPRVAREIGARGRQGLTVGVDTGWSDLTVKLGGWRRGKLYIVAGRPGMGKSAFLAGAALNVARQGFGAVFVSAEMDRTEIGERVLAAGAGLNQQQVAAGKLDGAEWSKVSEALRTESALPVAVAHQPAARIGDIRGAVRKHLRELGQRHGVSELGLVVVDYLQLLDGEIGEGESREREVAQLSKRLAWLAAEFNCPVLCASQLNRLVEQRPGKRPQLSDLRESGAIEQDAYAVLLMFREEYYKGTTPENRNKLEINIGKHRNGPTGKVWLYFDGASSRLGNLAHEYGSEAAE
jgi:replicative DNA helicase